MDDYDYDESLKPISPLGYVGFQFLFSLPGIGLICVILFAIFSKNQNVKNFAVAQLIVIILIMIAAVICGVLAVLSGVSLAEMTDAVQV